MKVTSEKVEGCQVALTVEVEPEEMKKALDGAYNRLKGKVEIPGFRKGKAPRNLLERHVGKESMDAEALDKLIPELYDQAIDEEQVEAIGQPELEMVQGDPPIFKATVPIRPVVELGDYHSIRITPDEVNITEENVDEGIENLRKLHAAFEPVEREAELSDMVTIDVVGKIDEKIVLDSKGSQYRMMAESKMPVPGFVEELVGMSIEEEKEFTLSFPEDHESEEMAGKDCDFKVTVSEIKEEILPELDDEFAEGLGQGIETAQQLREKMDENIRTAAERESRSKLENQIMDEIVDMSKIEFPAIFTEQEIGRVAEEQMMRLGGMQLEEFLRIRGISVEEFKDELRPAAEKRVVSSLILNQVFEDDNIEVTDEDMEAEVERIAADAGEDQADAIRKMFATDEARQSVKNRLLTVKTVERLVEIATSDNVKSTEETTEEAPEIEDETAVEEE